MDSFSFDDIIKSYAAYAEETQSIRAVFIIGSRARINEAADRWSDLDMVTVSTRAAHFIETTGWLEDIHPYSIAFLETSDVGNVVERRVLFDPDLDVDFVFVTPDQFKQLLKTSQAASVFARGFRTLLDKDGLEASLADFSLVSPSFQLDQSQFEQISQDFWYHCIWTMKKVLRGELWVAQHCLDCDLKRKLLTVIEWHARILHNLDTWHNGRFVEKWGDPRAVKAFARICASYDKADMIRALKEMMKVFRLLTKEIAEEKGFLYPQKADDVATRIVEACVKYDDFEQPGE